MLLINIKLVNTILNVTPVCAPHITNSEEEKNRTFYVNLQDVLNTTTNATKMTILPDLNTRIGNAPIDRVKQRFNEEKHKENGERFLSIKHTPN